MPKITIEIPDHYYEFYESEAEIIGCDPRRLLRRTLELAAEGGARGSSEESVAYCLWAAREELKKRPS